MTNKEISISAIQIEYSKVVTLLNASFCFKVQNFDYFSRAVKALGSSIAFENCRFENGYHLEGGALYLQNSKVRFLGHSEFLGNAAYYSGGAMFGNKSQIHMSGSGPFVGIQKTYIVGGTAFHVVESKLLYLVILNLMRNQITENTVEGYGDFKHCCGTVFASDSSLTMQGIFHFNNNSNILGGAILLYYSYCLISGHMNLEGNQAFLGSAIFAKSSSLIIMSDEYISSDSFHNKCFSISYPQSIMFCNNLAEDLGGAINLDASTMILTGSIIFVANKAKRGGGTSVYTSEQGDYEPYCIEFQEPLDIIFYTNIAKETGGAIYVDDEYLDSPYCEYPDYYYCFFNVNGLKLHINLNFTENKALTGGPGIYGGAIQFCTVETMYEVMHGVNALQKLMKTSTNILNLYDNFDVLQTLFCNKISVPNLVEDNIYINAQRGQVFNISVTVLTEFNFPIDERVVFTLINNDENRSSEIFGQPYNHLTEKGCRNLGFSILSKCQNEQLKLHTP